MKVLLITDVPPNKSFSGSLLTWHLCKNFDDQNLSSFFVMNKQLAHIKAEFPVPGAYQCKYLTRTREASLRTKRLPYFLTSIISYFWELRRRLFEVPALARKALEFAKEQKADRIWIILQGQTTILLAKKLIEKSQLPVHVQVWDSPRWWVKANRIDSWSAHNLYATYDYVLRKARQFGSPSFNMSEIYKKKYSRESFPLLGITPTPALTPPLQKADNKIVIGIAGQVYATDTFCSLIEALDSLQWTLDGKQIEIHYWGTSLLPLYRENIVTKEYVAQDRLCSQLAECDILYCPYWFDSRFEDEAKTSFPSKVTTYLQAGVIVFFHGPSYSSPGTLLEKHGAGICCFSNQTEVIKFHLRRALYANDKEAILNSAKNLVQTLLGENQLHSNFGSFLEIQLRS